MARFANVSCSQCGQDFGPGDRGFSSCAQHDPDETQGRALYRAAAEVRARLDIKYPERRLRKKGASASEPSRSEAPNT